MSETTTAPTPPDETLPIRTPLAVALSVLVSIVGLMVLAWGVLYVTKGRFLRGTFETVAGGLTDRTVRVGGDFQLYFDPLDLKFYAERMTVSNPAWATRPNLFAAERIDTRIAPLSLIFGRRRIHWLDLTNGAINLEWDAAHKANSWTFGSGGGEPMELPTIGRAMLAGTTLRYRDPRLRLLADL